MEIERIQRGIERTTLAFSAACCGVVIYLALFPGFYYMTGYALMLWLWLAVPGALLANFLGLTVLSRVGRAHSSSSRVGIFGYVAGMLVLVSLLVGFKLPLRASFLLAKPGLEEALADHRDDLSMVGIVHHDFGLYQIRGAHRGCHHEDRVFFQFLDDGEAAIIHSPSGIADLCYNAGSKGHLVGDWYWMKED